MPAEASNGEEVPCHDARGRLVARVRIWSRRRKDGGGALEHPELADLVRWPALEARTRGEEPVQLRERARYSYRVIAEAGEDWDLKEDRGIVAAQDPDALGTGEIETGDYCGVLPLVVVRRSDGAEVARGAVEVRSVKLNYRDHYRGMLSFISERCAGLLLESRSATRLRLSPEWRRNRAALEQQLEFLRQTLESRIFKGAVDEILRQPHRLLQNEPRRQPVSHPFKAGRDVGKQLAAAGARVALPSNHPLRSGTPALGSLPERITVLARRDLLDTAENRFVKMVLVEFRDFLCEVATWLGRNSGGKQSPDNARLLKEVARLRGGLETLLGRGFFAEVGLPRTVPLGSPVLQRKQGYREILRVWLMFHAGAQLAWDGGEEVWRAGARNVATLYEYWLFFQLEALFRSLFSCAEPLHTILVDRSGGVPSLKLKRGVGLQTPVGGVWNRVAGRPLHAEFHFNRKFAQVSDHQRPGSWTRAVQPDYTVSIWPAEFATAAEAEEAEVIVHVHFDAKYRIENVKAIFGEEGGESVLGEEVAETERRTEAKYADLLKMHAYRDAIRRTAGAYVLYPGNSGDGRKYQEYELQGFHEVLPGLGAFAVRPRTDGTADGLNELRLFLEDVVKLVSARDRERGLEKEEMGVHEEAGKYAAGGVAGGVSERSHHVVVAWCDSEAELEWIRSQCLRGEGLAYVRLGRRPGTWHVPPEFASARHVVFRTHGGVAVPGLWRLKRGGYRVFTGNDLARMGCPAVEGGGIYAVFDVEFDGEYAECRWDGAALNELLLALERRRGHLWQGLYRRSPDPRVLALEDLLKARV